MKKILLALAAALILAVPAVAKALPAVGSGTITLNQATPAFGDLLSFTTTGTDGLKNPRIWISCTQADVLVYGEGIGAGDTFKLGGGSSQWVTNGGGPAECIADLYWIPKANGHGEWKYPGPQGAPVVLATISFHAEG